ncbi:MAG: sugar phosphate isomerase/epimerase [Anaerolineae bacterium]|nr:sugar phosphate isomerase/epimerase [Anaerolineae bacterium]
MRLGVGSYTFPWAIGVPGYPPPRPMTASELLDRAHDLGVGVVQICENLPLHRLSPSALDSLASRARHLGIALEVGTRGIQPDHLLAYLDLARRLESPIVRTVTDTADRQPSDEEVVDALRRVAPAFEAARVSLAIENHGRHSAARLVRLLEAVGSLYVGICLDTTNSLGVLERPEETVAVLAPWAVNLHLKDYTIRRLDYQFGYVISGCPVGAGLLDVPAVLDRLRQAERDVNVIVELWTPPEPSLAETVAKQERWAEESVAYLQPLVETRGSAG